MSDRILSAVVYDSATNSYANLSPANSPLLINPTGDLVFNTNNLALYNNNSNNKIIRPNGQFSYLYGTNLDNVLIGSNNSTIIGGCQSIINSTDSIISGDYYTVLTDGTSCRYTAFSSITNSQFTKILNAGGWSSIYSSIYSSISGGQFSTIINGNNACIKLASFSTIMNGALSTIDGTISSTNTTGGKIASLEGAQNSNIHYSTFSCVNEVGGDLSRFNSILGGTGWANNFSLFNSSFCTNNGAYIYGGGQNKVTTSNNGMILTSFCSQICGVTNLANVRNTSSNTIACWRGNTASSIIGSDCSCIFNQVDNSLILGGCKNEIISSDYPIYFCGTDVGLKFDRVIQHSAILAGRENQIKMGASCSVIVGGYQNKICSGFVGSSILGGTNNVLGSNLTGCFSTINNGEYNSILGGYHQNISAGVANKIGDGSCNTILNGCDNRISQSIGIGNLIGNGDCNFIASNPTNVGSFNNTILNGKLNCNYSNLYSTIINGCNNKITSATSNYVLIGGGTDHCIVANASYSYILGGRCSIIQDSHCGAAILGDGQNRAHLSCGPDTLTLDFANGVHFAQTGVFGQINFSTRPKVNSTDILVDGDSNLVYNTGNQTISGIKTFATGVNINGNLGIGISSPSEKLQVVGNILANNLVYNTGNQTISGVKNFTSTPQVNGTTVALSNNVVDLSTSQNINGTKYFSSTPLANGSPVATLNDLVSYVNTYQNQNIGGVKNFTSTPQVNGVNLAVVGNFVDRTTNQSIGGVKNFTSIPQYNSVNLAVSNNVVDTTTTQSIGGVKNFTSIPQYNSVNLAVSNNVVDRTTNQSIGGVKNFSSTPTVNGAQVLVFGQANPVPVEIYQNGSLQGNASALDFGGNGVSVSTAGGIATITYYPGGGGGGFVAPPVTPNSPGTLNDIAIDLSYLYVCIATNKWVRTALSSW